jgi:regulatory protein
MNPTYKQLVQQVLGYLAVRNRSEQEIRQYLEKKTSDGELLEQVVAYFIDHGLINDQEFGSQWTRSRVRRQKGDRLIIQELERKGIPAESARETVAAIDNADWFAEMAAFIEKKSTKLANLNPYQKKGKIYQLLAQRGYSSKLIDAFLRREVE